MKIAIWHNLPSGGGKRALFHHVKELLQKGHILESWCPYTATQKYLPLQEFIPEHIHSFSGTREYTRKPFKKVMKDYYAVTDTIEAMDKHCKQCAEEINNRDFDVLFVNPCMFLRVPPIARYVTIPTVLYLQEPNRRLYEAFPKLPWLAFPPPRRFWWSPRYVRLFLKDLVKVQGLRVQAREEFLNARAFDLILVNSFFSRESVLRTYGLEAKVCYLGVDTDLFSPDGSECENYVVGVGGVYYGKGIERAIRAIGAIDAKKRPRLLWIGNFSDDGYQKSIHTLAKSLDVSIDFKIGISDNDVIHFLSKALVIIYTSRLEPFGFGPLEANACGIPAVAIAEGGVRESIQPNLNGILVYDDDPQALGKAVLRFIEQPALRDEMGKRARHYVVEKWNWHKAGEALEKYLLSA